MAKILITGGNGFIGSHVLELFLTNGYDVDCLVRKSSNLDNIKHLKVKFRFSDIREKENLINIFKDYSAVIHIAALVNDWNRYDDFYEINVMGTLNVVNACLENNIKNIILTSSCSVYGEENNKIIKTEKSQLHSHYPYFLDRLFPCKLNYYRDTKRIAREKVIDFAKNNNMDITFIEPVWVFGEREFNTGFFEYLKTASLKIPALRNMST